MSTDKIKLSEESLDKIRLQHIRRELSGYYTGADLVVRAVETLANFKQANANPMDFIFCEESRVDEQTFQTKTWLGWKLRGADYNAILIKD